MGELLNHKNHLIEIPFRANIKIVWICNYTIFFNFPQEDTKYEH